MALKFYTTVAKELKLKVRKFWGLITMFVEVTEEKLVGSLLPPILNRVKGTYFTYLSETAVPFFNTNSFSEFQAEFQVLPTI